jgi:hypothetical protein
VSQAVVSFRSVPRILKLFNRQTPFTLGWIPHFTSVINWTLRLGLGMLKQVKPINTPWLAIIDHSIDIGTKKALVVLRVTMDALSKNSGAIQLKDCECIGLAISETVNGESISQELSTIFNQAGIPRAIIKDCDRTLNKGVRLCSEKLKKTLPVIDDTGHVMASILKSQFEKTDDYKQFTSLVSQAGKNLRQTALAFLTPPKLRTKGRFQSVSRLGKWGSKILDVLTRKNDICKEDISKLRKAIPDLEPLEAFINQFAQTSKITSEIMERLKNKGLDPECYRQCCELTEQIENTETKQHIFNWLKKHLDLQQQLTHLPLLVSSDIIESLFGHFKHIIERSPQADMNRTTLLLPVLCGNHDELSITQALNHARHDDLKQWEKTHIPYTMRKKRQDFFSEVKPKTDNICCL